MNLKKIRRLLSLILTHPIFFLLSVHATVKAFTIAQKKFPETASTNGIGNAFRHSLWCCFIIMYCCKVSSPRKALNFCKRMTDIHEELLPNHPLEAKMDLHNNQFGMDYFMELLPGIHRQFFEKSFFVEGLIKKMENAKVLKSLDDEVKGHPVYLKE